MTRQWLLGTEQLQTLVTTDIKEICYDFDYMNKIISNQ